MRVLERLGRPVTCVRFLVPLEPLGTVHHEALTVLATLDEFCRIIVGPVILTVGGVLLRARVVGLAVVFFVSRRSRCRCGAGFGFRCRCCGWLRFDRCITVIPCESFITETTVSSNSVLTFSIFTRIRLAVVYNTVAVSSRVAGVTDTHVAVDVIDTGAVFTGV